MNQLKRVLPCLFAFALFASACAQQNTTQPSASPSPEATEEVDESPSPKLEGDLFEADLTGAEEKPGPGDPDGSGKATIGVDERNKRVCFELEASGIGAPDNAHIHEGAAGVAGDIVVTLVPPSGSSAPFKSSDCVAAEADLLAKIKAGPQNFYVNIHNAEFAAGAIRGQLKASA
jgi:hypothetical protein